MKTLSIAALTLALLAGCATGYGSKPPAEPVNGVLVGPNGMTLYTFDNDKAGSAKSVCNGPCATNWPPLMAPKTQNPPANSQ